MLFLSWLWYIFRLYTLNKLRYFKGGKCDLLNPVVGLILNWLMHGTLKQTGIASHFTKEEF